jgi:hypothetical protein
MPRTILAELVLDAATKHGEGPVWHPVEHTLDCQLNDGTAGVTTGTNARLIGTFCSCRPKQ